MILAEGGLTTRWSDIRPTTIVAALLATVGVGISVGLMTLFGYYVLGLPFWIAMLLARSLPNRRRGDLLCAPHCSHPTLAARRPGGGVGPQ